MENHYLKQELYKLIQSDQKIFDFLQEASLDGIWYWNLQTPEEEWMSPKFWTTLGYDPNEMPHKANAWQDIIHPEDLEAAKQNLQAHLKDPSRPYDQIVRYQHKDGHTIWVRCRGLAIRDQDNQPIRMLGAHNNITKLKETEARLAKENRQLNGMLGNSGIYILTIDLEGKYSFFNEKFKKDFGWNPFIALGKDSLPSIHPDDHQACMDTVTQCMEHPGQAFEIDLRKPKREGGWQTNRWNFSLQTDPDGQPESILCIGYDISHKKQIQREYKLIIDNIGDAVVTTDTEGAILYTSKSWHSHFGHDREASVGQLLSKYCALSDRRFFSQFLAETAAGSSRTNTLEHQLISGSDAPFWVETKCSYDTDGNCLIFLFRDISERKTSELELQAATSLLNETQKMAQIGGWSLNPKTGYTVWTEQVYRIHEVSLDFEHNKEFALQFYHPDDQKAFSEALDESVQKLSEFDLSFQFITAKGNRKWVRITGTPIIQDGVVQEIQGFFQDITAQKEALIELESNREQLASVTENIPGTVMQYKLYPDQSDEILYASQGAKDIFGIEPEEAVENVNLLWDAMLPEYVDGISDAINISAANMTPFSYDWEVRHTDGSLRWVNGKGTPKKLPDGSILWNTLIVDISPLKKAQKALENQGRMQQKLMHIATEYINFPNEEMDARIQASLEEIGNFVNADRAYIIQYDFRSETISNTHEWCGEGIAPMIQSLQKLPMERYQLLVDHHIKGDIFFVPDIDQMPPGPAKKDLQRQGIKSLITVPMINEGKCFGFVGFDAVKQVRVYTDTELKFLALFSEVLVNAINRTAIERKLQSSREKLSKLTATVPGALFQMEMDQEGNIDFPFVSQGIRDLHPELTPERLKQNPTLGLAKIHPEDLTGVMEKTLISKERLTPFFAEYRSVHPGNKVRWHNAMSQPEQREDGTVVWYGIFQDITEQKRLEKIQKFALELEVKNKELEQFTFVASHDLQEPLRTIKSYSGLLLKRYADQLDEDGQQFLQFISEASLRMSHLIKGLLEYSQIGRSREARQINCNQLLESVVQDLSSSIEQHNAQIAIDDLPILEGYPIELHQLFQNLLSNAIKFHKPGTVPTVRVTAKEKEDCWQFAVKDNGIGIAPEYQKKIFTIFQRLHLSKDYDGTGIGLAHCKKIVEMHNGRIWLKSQEGDGATFFFTLKKGGYESKIE